MEGIRSCPEVCEEAGSLNRLAAVYCLEILSRAKVGQIAGVLYQLYPW